MKYVYGVFGLIFKLYVGLVFLITLLFFYPFIYITLLKIEWRRYSFPINVVWSTIMRICCLVWVISKGKKQVPKGPYILVSNHSSYYDIFFMYSLMPNHRFLFLGKSEILSYPLVKTFFKKLNIPVHRKDRSKAAKSFIQAIKAVDNGWSLIIFPEGGIPDENLPQMIPFKDGAFKLAKRCKIPIVPMTFTDNYKLFSDPDKLLGRAHPGVSRVYYHPVITPEQYENWTEQELSDYVFNVLAQPLRDQGLM